MIQEFGATILFGVLTLFLLVIGRKRGFFLFSPLDWQVPIRLIHVIGAFTIYFIVELLFVFFSSQIRELFSVQNPILYISAVNFALSTFIYLSLQLYRQDLPTSVKNGILRRSGEAHSIRSDLYQAFFAWVLAFPFTSFLSQILEQVVRILFRSNQLPDQLAVRFLKSTFETPSALFFAILSIIVLAPLVEETLFRGFLQTYIRRHLGSKYAIVVTSVCFAMFHYSAAQGLGNIPVILPLFVFALFLGHLYEKQGSLRASMFLHGLFNAVNVVNLYLFGGFAPGL